MPIYNRVLYRPFVHMDIYVKRRNDNTNIVHFHKSSEASESITYTSDNGFTYVDESYSAKGATLIYIDNCIYYESIQLWFINGTSGTEILVENTDYVVSDTASGKMIEITSEKEWIEEFNITFNI